MGKIFKMFNFDNIGGKIKALAKWSCWITILITWLATPHVFMLVASVSNGYTGFLACIICAVVLPIGIWIGSWVMYAFGEFVENIHITRSLISGMDNNIRLLAVQAMHETEEKAKREAEERAKYETEVKAKREAEERAKYETEVAIKSKVEEYARQETKKAAKEPLTPKTLSEKLSYALQYRTDEGMIKYLQGIQDESVKTILNSPQHLIRDEIKNMLNNM